MKHYVDILRECPIKMLKAKIKRLEAEAEIIKRDLETMRCVLEERSVACTPGGLDGDLNQEGNR